MEGRRAPAATGTARALYKRAHRRLECARESVALASLTASGSCTAISPDDTRMEQQEKRKGSIGKGREEKAEPQTALPWFIGRLTESFFERLSDPEDEVSNWL